jgi:hypothetical protein
MYYDIVLFDIVNTLEFTVRMLFGTDDRAREKSGAKATPHKKLDSSDRGFGVVPKR